MADAPNPTEHSESKSQEDEFAGAQVADDLVKIQGERDDDPAQVRHEHGEEYGREKNVGMAHEIANAIDDTMSRAAFERKWGNGGQANSDEYRAEQIERWVRLIQKNPQQEVPFEAKELAKIEGDVWSLEALLPTMEMFLAKQKKTR